MPRTNKFPFRSDVRARLIDVATRGQTVNYLDLGVGRAMVGRYLYRIALEEGRAVPQRPPLTAVVVRKVGGRPGEGFRDAMIDAGYVDREDPRSDDEIWASAITEVHQYWRPKLVHLG